MKVKDGNLKAEKVGLPQARVAVDAPLPEQVPQPTTPPALAKQNGKQSKRQGDEARQQGQAD